MHDTEGSEVKAFETSLEKAKKMKHADREIKLYSVTQPVYAHENEPLTYNVKIGRDPSYLCHHTYFP